MNERPAGLLELALSEQESRNSAAIAAIRARGGDITEAQRLVEALGARGFKVRAIVDTQPIGALAVCDIALWMSATGSQLAEALTWLATADIAVARDILSDRGDLLVYRLVLRGQKLRLNVAVHSPLRTAFQRLKGSEPASRSMGPHTPEAA